MSTEIAKVKELSKEEKQEFTTAVETYVDKALYNVTLDPYFKLPQENKIAFLQYTRNTWKKSRELGSTYDKDTKKWSKQISEYIPVRKLERLLNFLFNFQWDSEVIDKDFIESKVTTKAGKETTIYEAFALVKFTATFLGNKISRTVSGSFKMYENPATSKFAVIQASISQAKRNFAKEFGIGSDLNDEDLVAENRFATKKEEVESSDIENNLNNFS